MASANAAIDASPLPLGRSACAYGSASEDGELLADGYDDDELTQFYSDIRSARRRNRIASVARFDVFYKTYITALFVGVGLYLATGIIGDRSLSQQEFDFLRKIGSQWIGLFVAFSVVIGLRSGGRGGPLAFELADVRHVLLSPAERLLTIRRPAMRHLLHAVFLGVCAGAIVGLIASRRMPHHFVFWVGCGAVFGAAVAAIGTGVALLASGLRIPRVLCDVLAVIVIVWSVIDIWLHIATSPATWLGAFALLPLQSSFLVVPGLCVVVALVLGGVLFCNRVSMETTERRSWLVGQLQFAATMQDLRTVMVLQRQLSQEHLRQRSRLRVFRRRKAATNADSDAAQAVVVRQPGEPIAPITPGVLVKRCWWGMARWSTFRMVRLVALVAFGVAALVGVWHGTSPLIIVAGLCFWIAALDLVEPLAQEFDRPDRLDGAPREAGRVNASLLMVPYFMMFSLLQAGFLVASRFLDPRLPGLLWPITIVATMCAVGGAAMVVAKRTGMSSGIIDPPEVASVKMLWKSGAPPFVAIVGVFPVAVAQRSWSMHHDVLRMTRDINMSFIFAMVVSLFAFAYVRYSSELRKMMESAAVEQQAKADAAKMAAKSKSEEKKALSKHAQNKAAQRATRGTNSAKNAKKKGKK